MTSERSAVTVGSALEQLEAYGYRAALRVDGFVECLVVRGAERWLGRGTTADEAVSDALAQMLPSHLACALWERLRATDPAAAAIHAPPVASAVAAVAFEAIEPPAGDAPGEAEIGSHPAEPSQGEEASLGAPAPDDTSAAVTDAAAPPVAASPPRLEATADRAVVVTRPAEAPRGNGAANGPDRAPTLAKLVSLQNQLQRDRPRLARLAPNLLRLEMLTLICRARAHTEVHPHDPIVERAVGDVARDLTELGKLWWPGSVRALQLKASPVDIVRDIEPRPSDRPATWTEAATLTARVLERLRGQGGRAEGWADDAECEPPPAEPGQMFVAAVAVARDKAATDAALLDAARKLRWLRPALGADDAEAWGEAVGRLRQRADRGAMTLRGLLDPAYRPAPSWAREVGQDPAARERKKRRSKLLRRIPRADATPADVAAWLCEAFELGGELPNPKIAICTRHLEPVILALGDEDLPVDERRHRKRLRSLQEILEGGEPLEDDEDIDDLDDVDDDDDDDDDAGLALLALVRPHVVGQRALLLSNRSDPGLERQLEDALGLDITMSLVDPRRRQAAAAAVESGSYAMVLAAHRFIGHDVDKDIGQKARAGGIPYVRVGSGRVGSVVRALAREVGVTV